MAFQTLSGVFLVRLSRSRHLSSPHVFSSSIPFSTLDNHTTQSKASNDDDVDKASLTNGSEVLSVVNESFVLNELSNLLPISSNIPKLQPFPRNCRHISEQRIECRAVSDVVLTAEERLRGVFLQKLKGKYAIERALTDVVGADLSLDLVAKVLDRGNLSVDSMICFFNWAIKHPMISKDISSYNVLFRALGRRKYVDFIVKLLQELRMEGVCPDMDTLSIVMDGLVRARRVNKAIEVFENTECFGFEQNIESLNVLLQYLCKRSHVGVANSYLNLVKGKLPFNCMTYNIVIGGWSKFGRVGEMERVLEAMVEDGFNPDCLTFSCLIEGLGRAGQNEDAIKTFDSMKENGCVPDTSVYNAMISNFISIGNFDVGMKYYRSLLSSDSEPNIDTYTKLIFVSIKARKVADALELFDEMIGRGIIPSTGTITSFIEPLCSFGPPHAAMMIYKKVKRAGCKLSSSAYKLLLMRLSRFGKCGMLLNLWNDMQESGYSSDSEVYEYVINGLCNVGQLENAALVMEESICKGFCPSRLIYSKLTNKLLESNKVENAYKLYLMIKDARHDCNARRHWRVNGWHFY